MGTDLRSEIRFQGCLKNRAAALLLGAKSSSSGGEREYHACAGHPNRKFRLTVVEDVCTQRLHSINIPSCAAFSLDKNSEATRWRIDG